VGGAGIEPVFRVEWNAQQRFCCRSAVVVESLSHRNLLNE
jgi:hypothetical protein